MLRPDLAPLEIYLADAMLLSEEEFFERHPDPVLVIPEPDPEVIRELIRPETLVPGEPIPALYDFLDPRSDKAAGASLDAICLTLRPRDGLSCDRITLGRDPEADIVLLDSSISKIHAELSWDDASGRCMLTDLGSRNGTFVSDDRLGNRANAELRAGSHVRFGTLLARFYPPRAFLAWLSTGMARAGAPPARRP